MIEISNKNITLKTMSQKEMRALWRKYIPEEGMPEYVYNEEAVDKRYEKTLEREEWNPTVGIFTRNSEIVGELTFERIVYSENRCDLSIFLANESYRNKGIGTEAILLAKKYAKESLGLKRMYADVSVNNLRMQRALKKSGFLHTKTFRAETAGESDRMMFVSML